MPPIRAIRNTATTLARLSHSRQVAANNVANVNTHGFKATQVGAAIMAGEETAISTTGVDFRQGALSETGRPLDVAILGDAFLVAEVNGAEMLTRGGSLQVDDSGFLIDRSGNRILGTDGPITIGGGVLEFGSDGTIVLDGDVSSRLKMVRIAEGAMLSQTGDGYIQASAVEDVQDGYSVQQFNVEESNQSAVEGMLDLLEIQRNYMASMKALTAMDKVLSSIVRDVGQV